MLSRTWRAWALPEDAERFEVHLARTGIAEVQRLRGYRGHLLTRDHTEGQVRFTLTTPWVNLPAVRAFAGDDLTAARSYPEDERWLVAADERVEHATVLSAIALWVRQPLRRRTITVESRCTPRNLCLRVDSRTRSRSPPSRPTTS